MKNTNLLATIVAGITLLCLWLPAKAQHPCQDDVFQNSLWSLPDLYAQFPDDDEDNVLLNNLPIPPEASPTPDPLDYDYYSGYKPAHAHNAIHDQNGNLKFFIVDDKLFNKDGYGMSEQFNGYAYGDPNDGNIKGNSEICVVPDPADCERYYLFTSTIVSSHENSAFYSLLDMSQPNSLNPGIEGELITTPLYGGSFESVMATLDFYDTGEPPLYNEIPYVNFHFAATPLRADNSRLVLMYASGQGTLFKMKIDDTGIHPIGVDGFSNPSGRSRAEMEVFTMPNGNYKVAMGDRHAIQLCELDNNGTMIPGSQEFIELWDPLFSDIPYVKGLEFSENGDYLYFTHHHIPTNAQAIQYVDWSTMQIGTISLPNGGEEFQYSQIELGVDGKLYFAWEDGLAALSDPDNPNVNNFEPNEIPIPDYHLSDAGYPGQEPLKAYLLPDQIDGMNYYDHFLVEEDIECCLHHPPYDAYNATATTSATWSPEDNPFHQDPDCNVVLINNELRIPDGVFLTIEDMRFEFSEYARVVIEPGGRLTMKNTIFTYGPCGDRMWLGVEVWGEPTAGQYPISNQGFLDMKNNSIIEHAWIGAVAGSRNGVGSTPPVFSLATGGVIMATDSKFRNNQRDVVIQVYNGLDPNGNPTGNRSQFTRCDFLTESLLNYPSVMPITRVDLLEVSDVKFKDCSFRNLASFEDFEMEDRGKGIRSVDATFRVTGENEPYTGNEEEDFQTFYQFETAVDVNGFEPHHFTISNMEFQDNFMGIYVKGACFETITFNNFHIPEFYNARGAELINSYLFTVEENHFFSGSALNKNIGLIIDNSSKGVGEEEDAEYEGEQVENEVYRNTFEDLWGGLLVRNDNRGEVDQHGLQARCNQFINNHISDIFLDSYSEWRVNQGNINPPESRTNNVFSYANPVCASSFRDVRVSGLYGANAPGGTLYFDYFSFENDETRPVMDAFYEEGGILLCNQPQMYVIENDNDFDYETHCPSNFNTGGGGKYDFATLLQRQDNAENNLESAKTIYQVTIDGGSTQDVVDLLQNTHNDESAYLRDLLMENYPLSRKALMAAIDAAEAFDPWHLTQVLVANSPLPGDVYQFLRNHEVLSSFFMQFIHSAQTNSEASLARLLQSEISLRSYEKSHAERDIHRHFLVHTDSIDVSGWSNYLSGREDTYYKLYRIGDHLNKGEIGAAQLLRDSLNIHPDRLDWIDFRISLAIADTVTSADLDEGWHFFGKAATQGDAWGWLTGMGELDSIQPLPDVVEPRNFSIHTQDDQTETDRWLEAYPNPAKDRVVLTYPHEADGIGAVQLFNADGRLMKEFSASDTGFQEINLTGWPTGLYIAKLIVNDKAIDTVKINVVK